MSKKHTKQRGKNTIEMTAEYPGLISCVFEHEIKETKANLVYSGPVIPREVWQQVLSFFKWTYDTTHSESQVRLYVNPDLKTWAAWAYPQEAKTGMSARELDNPEAHEQRTQFRDSEGWLYFGTVHHHCSASAFQSGTDRANEEKQDGLHITVGNMNEPRYTLHARLYYQETCWDDKGLDMTLFWDVGDVLTNLPDAIRRVLPDNALNRIARAQMCEPSTVEFPQQWKDNLIEIKTPKIEFPSRTHGQYSLGFHGAAAGSEPPYFERCRAAAVEILKEVVAGRLAFQDIDAFFALVDSDDAINNILEICWRRGVEVNDVDKYIDEVHKAGAVTLDDKEAPKQLGNGDAKDVDPKAVYNADENRWEYEGGYGVGC